MAIDRIDGVPRRNRIHFEGAIYHAMARGVDGRDIYIDDRDRTRFLDGMRRFENEFSARIIAYCLMNNHFHLAVQVASVPLAEFMQRLKGEHASAFNSRYGRVGHLFQSRYKAKLCLDDRYLMTLIHYIHMNPVRAGLVSDPRDWPWSSASSWSGPYPDLEGFDPWLNAETKINNKSKDEKLRSLDEIGAIALAQSLVTVNDLRSGLKTMEATRARRRFVLEAVKHGHSLADSARWLHTTRSAVGRYTQEAAQQ